jgi:integrase
LDNTKRLEELIWEIPDRLREKGLSVATISGYMRGYAGILNYHRQSGARCFDRKIMTEYVTLIGERCERNEITKQQYRNYLRAAEQLTEYHDTGKFEWTVCGRVSKFALNGYYEDLLSSLLASKDFHPNTRGDVIWVCRKYFAWLIDEGFADLSKTGTTHIRGFIVFCSRHMAVNSLRSIQLHLRNLYEYLTASKIVDTPYQELLAIRLNRQAKLYPATSRDEINKILEMIDRHTPKGKRDYAIILLGIVGGLRAIDVACLKFSDIDWINGEIKFVQSKTDESMALPLTEDVGTAIRDYIENGRQRSESQHIFLRTKAPFQGFANGVAVEDIYDDYRKKAGLPRNANDGKGFHSLRRTLGRDLTISGSPMTMTAQILGHVKIGTVKKYIPLDSVHLKECALSFEGIAPNGGDVQ